MSEVKIETRKEAALSHAARGWRVLPLAWPKFNQAGDFVGCSCGNPNCASPGKHPLIKAWQVNATTDPATIDQWWSQWPNANIGIATGEASNLAVIDIDIDKETGEFVGLATLAKIEEVYGETPATLEVETGSGGLQLYHLHPGIEVRNSQSEDAIDHIDFRGDGGYVVAPGSMHASGRPYRFVDESKRMVDLPTWALNWRIAKIKPIEVEPAGQGQAEKIIEPPKPPLASLNGKTPKYVEAALRAEVARVANAAKGSRNAALNRAAFSLYQLAGAGVLDESTVATELGQAARSIGLEDTEIEKTLKSAREAGMSKPRDLSKVNTKAKINVEPKSEAQAEEPKAGEEQEGQGGIPLDLMLTETGNAVEFEKRCKGTVIYAIGRGWLVWNGKVFEEDTIQAEVTQVMRGVAYAWHDRSGEALKDGRKTEAEMMSRFARISLSNKSLNASLEQAKKQAGLKVKVSELDADPMLLNAQNGIVDLRTGELMPHDPTKLMTRIAAANYDPTAQAPTWKKFLNDIFQGRQDMIDFFRRWLGYNLTGKVNEQKYVIAWGKGGNGKSTLYNLAGKVMGSYAQTADAVVFTAKREKSDVNVGLAKIPGARMIVCTEWNDTARPDETLLKDVTGGDVISTRTLYEKSFEFRPACKLNIFGNEKPDIKGTDFATWRRILLVPFEATFSGASDDKDMGEKLLAEADGILADLVRGCLEWQAQGLNPPADVADATKKYRADQDELERFISERCEVDQKGRVVAESLWDAYKKFGGSIDTQNKFGRAMRERGYKSEASNGVRFYPGLTLLGSASAINRP